MVRIMIKRLYYAYKKLLFCVYGRQLYGVLPIGSQCVVVNMEDTPSKGDIVHPCVRYIPEGFRGHRWWMVYTPYYCAKSKMENPILCWGKSEGVEPPLEWVVEETVVGVPIIGYNSDPYMLYENGRIIVFWRENDTERTTKAGMHHAVFAKTYEENGNSYDFNTPVLYSKDFYYDNEVSPVFLKKGDKYVAYATHFRFKLPWVQFRKKTLRKFANKILMVLNILDIYSQQKMFGLAIWDGDKALSDYKYSKTVKWKNCCSLYKPWHLDMFEHGGKIYAVVQSNSENGDILLAESLDGLTFSLFNKPLITAASIKMTAIYKPTACVIDGAFHLFYTAQNPKEKGLNKLFVTSLDFADLLDKVR